MRICRFNEERLGVVRDDLVFDVTEVLTRLPKHTYPYPTYDLLIANLSSLRPHIEELANKKNGVPVDSVALQSPVANPGKLIAAPVNYVKHLEEARADVGLHHNTQIKAIREMGFFLKATSSLIGASGAVQIRFPDRRNDHEIELAVIIGRKANRVSADEALDYVAGYCIGLDMTVRGPEERSLRKSVDTYSVLGPWIVTTDELRSPADVELELTVNGQTRQKANTRDLVLSVAELIEFATCFYTLHPGDVIFTGTPEGVGPVVAGDKIVAKLSGIGSMSIDVVT